MDEKNKTSEKESIGEIQSHQEGKLTKKIRENPWILSTFVLGILSLILLIGNFGGMTGGIITGGAINEGEINELALDFFNNKLSGGQGEGSIESVNEESGLYEIVFSIDGQNVPLYFTKDGKWIQQGNELVSLTETSQPSQQQPTEILKSDKPEVELFIMTHCPYGTQAEKGIIPVIKALGDTIDVKIRFVHYFMHDPEEIETPIQVCIREEQPSKWYAYLGCFLEDGDSDRCLIEAKIDQGKMNKCISSGKSDGYYGEDSDLSNSYGVGGSPSLVINGVQASSGRDSASYLKTICSAFNEAPEECNEVLSSASPSPGFGYGTGSATSAQC